MLDTWLATARDLHTTSPSSPVLLTTLRKDPELTLLPQGGPLLGEDSGFSPPPYLGDIMTSVAAGLSQQSNERIQTGVQFSNAMKLLAESGKEEQKIFYEMIVALEFALRRRSDAKAAVSKVINLSEFPTDNKTPFVWIAYANLPDGVLTPAAPILFQQAAVDRQLTAQPQQQQVQIA